MKCVYYLYQNTCSRVLTEALIIAAETRKLPCFRVPQDTEYIPCPSRELWYVCSLGIYIAIRIKNNIDKSYKHKVKQKVARCKGYFSFIYSTKFDKTYLWVGVRMMVTVGKRGKEWKQTLGGRQKILCLDLSILSLWKLMELYLYSMCEDFKLLLQINLRKYKRIFTQTTKNNKRTYQDG